MVVENIKLNGQYTFVAMRSDYEKYNLSYVLEAIAPGCNIISSAEATEGILLIWLQGPSHTLLLAKTRINNDMPLLIVNCHQFIEYDAKSFHEFCHSSDADGIIATFTNNHPRYSYVSLDPQGLVTEVAEKKTISSIASCGIYYWKRGSEFVKYAEQMIANHPNSPLDCSVIMAYREGIVSGLKIRTFDCEHSWQLKFPKDLESFYRARKIIQVWESLRRQISDRLLRTNK